MIRERREGSLVTLICDSGDRYTSTYFNAGWLKENGMRHSPLPGSTSNTSWTQACRGVKSGDAATRVFT